MSKNGKGPEQPGKYAGNLRQAKKVIDDLYVENARISSEHRQSLAFLGALLDEHHGGKANVHLAGTQKYAKNERGIQFKSFAQFGILALQTMDVSALQKPVIEIPKHTIENPGTPETESPTEPSPACADQWHADPNAMGARCGVCGSNAKAEPVATN